LLLHPLNANLPCTLAPFQNKTKQNKTKQNKTKQNKTKPNKNDMYQNMSFLTPLKKINNTYILLFNKYEILFFHNINE